LQFIHDFVEIWSSGALWTLGGRGIVKIPLRLNYDGMQTAPKVGIFKFTADCLISLKFGIEFVRMTTDKR